MWGIIKVTRYNEPIDAAIQSVVACHKEFVHVTVVSRAGPPILPKRYQDMLHKVNVPFTFTTKPEHELVIPDTAQYAVNLEPMCVVEPIVFTNLLEHMNRQDNVQRTHFSVVSRIEDEARFRLAYGWLLVLVVFEYMWWAWDNCKLMLTRYVHLRKVVRYGKISKIAPHQLGWRIYNDGQAKSLTDNEAWTTVQPGDTLNGWLFVKNYIYRNEYVGNLRKCVLGNIWISLWVGAYWIAMSNLILRSSTVYVLLTLVYLGTLAMFHFITRELLYLKGKWLLMILHPLYIMSFVIMLFIGRLSVPATHWKRIQFAK